MIKLSIGFILGLVLGQLFYNTAYGANVVFNNPTFGDMPAGQVQDGTVQDVDLIGSHLSYYSDTEFCQSFGYDLVSSLTTSLSSGDSVAWYNSSQLEWRRNNNDSADFPYSEIVCDDGQLEQLIDDNICVKLGSYTNECMYNINPVEYTIVVPIHFLMLIVLITIFALAVRIILRNI
jgi:hypothetical protein